MEPGGPPVGYRLRRETKRYWIKCTIALQILADALRPFVDKTFRDYHQSQALFTEQCDHSWRCTDDCPQLHHHVTYECGGCGETHRYHSEYYPYWYGYHFCNHKGNCPCHDNGVTHLNRRKGKEWVFEGCDQCKEAFGLLKCLFVDQNPDKMYWTNVKMQNVFSNHWEIAKVFMPRGNNGTDTPEQADAAALLTVVNTCNLFQNRIDHSLADALCRERNGLLHNSTNDVDKRTCQKLIKDVEKFLTYFDISCHKQQRELTELKDKHVTAEMIDKAIEADIQNLLNTISDKTAAGEDVTDLVRRLKEAIEMQQERKIERKCHDLERENKHLKESVHRLQIENNALKTDNAHLKFRNSLYHERVCNLERQITDLKSENENLKQDVEQLKVQLGEREQLMKRQNENIERLREVKNYWEKYLHGLQKENDDLKTDKERLESENENQKQDVEQLRKQLGDKERLINRLKNNIGKLMKEFKN